MPAAPLPAKTSGVPPGKLTCAISCLLLSAKTTLVPSLARSTMLVAPVVTNGIGWQAPAEHEPPVRQLWPHLPQLLASVPMTLMQFGAVLLPQFVVPPGQEHVPPVHVDPPEHDTGFDPVHVPL